jgi:hypothetical protein
MSHTGVARSRRSPLRLPAAITPPNGDLAGTSCGVSRFWGSPRQVQRDSTLEGTLTSIFTMSLLCRRPGSSDTRSFNRLRVLRGDPFVSFRPVPHRSPRAVMDPALSACVGSKRPREEDSGSEPGKGPPAAERGPLMDKFGWHGVGLARGTAAGRTITRAEYRGMKVDLYVGVLKEADGHGKLFDALAQMTESFSTPGKAPASSRQSAHAAGENIRYPRFRGGPHEGSPHWGNDEGRKLLRIIGDDVLGFLGLEKGPREALADAAVVQYYPDETVRDDFRIICVLGRCLRYRGRRSEGVATRDSSPVLITVASVAGCHSPSQGLRDGGTDCGAVAGGHTGTQAHLRRSRPTGS